jgi:uncharacterized protein (TIGR02594 family)
MDAGVADPRQATGLYHDETPWCGAYVAHVTRLSGLRIPDAPARARSWLGAGMPIDLAEARVGWDVVVLQRGDGQQPGPDVLDAPGHVGWFAGLDVGPDNPLAPTGVRLLGGNQNNCVSVATFPLRRLLGVRRLWSEV